MEQVIVSEQPKPKLFKKGQISRLIDFDLPDTFTSVGSIDISTISKSGLTIYCYGLTDLYDGVTSDIISYSYISKAGNESNWAVLNTTSGAAVFSLGYQISDSEINFGLLTSSTSGYDVLPPYRTITLRYAIYYY